MQGKKQDNFNFPEMEKKWLTHWYKNGVIKKYLSKNKSSQKYFSFLDGPITANNPMGVHHAWGRTYKDLWPKFFNLLGYKERFQNGFDCQGLWVEVEVEKELKLKSKKDIENLIPGDPKASVAKFVELCKQRVLKYSGIQTEQSKRLGYFADWEHSYYTMSDTNNYMIWHFLKTCYEHGWIYKGHESVPWCPRCETAISEHEILTEDYKELVHDSIYFLLPIVGTKNEHLLVWTTTPWTIPANIAVAVDKKFDYSLVEIEGVKMWMVREAIKTVLRPKVYKVLKSVKGKGLVGLKYEGPFDDIPAVQKVAQENKKTFHTVIPTDERILPISKEEGTGMVHTAVSAGTEDFKLGKKLGLPMIPVIEDNADYMQGLGFLSGKNAKKHPEIILDYLKEKDVAGPKRFVFKIEKYKHRYPACWRCKTELVWKVADEWYIAMDVRPLQTQKSNVKSQNLKTKTLRERMVEVAKKIKWMPEFGLDRELDWLKNMHDWLISKKNRYWGLALPIYECKKCGNFEVIGSKKELKDKSVSGWDQFEGHTPHKPFIDEVKIKCSKCKEIVDRIDDVGNPWLDAGIVGFSTVAENNQGEPLYFKNKDEWKKWVPADFITESFAGQFKNWFYALIAEATVLENEPQFKRVLGYVTLLGEDGRPMHKSWGNSIEFQEGADKIGVDVMRWMFSRQDPSQNLLFGYKKADEVRRQFYLILWNVYKFYQEYSYLDKFNVKRLTLKNERKHILDRWILSRFANLVLLVKKYLQEFNPKDAALETEKFVSDLSTWYIRRSRERIWVNSEDSEDKKSFYDTLHYVLFTLSSILSPFMPFVSEEMYTHLVEAENREASVHLSFWPEPGMKYIDNDLEVQMRTVRAIVEVAHSKRKELKIKLRQPLASVRIGTNLSLAKEYSEELEAIIRGELNVKKIIWKKGKEEINLEYDTEITKELELEGKVRDLIRTIQQKRKELRIQPKEQIQLTIPSELEQFADAIGKKVMAREIKMGPELNVET
ncbi:isoleucine--tRNA ligase [Candidatus Roizmanbacteria bacterium RIFCSPHIGHO2_12_FULL_39_8]|uniref:Isoleucine--tRNA ligase n=1 Tax=Candidatus Roizmanbacteria bacterium RIFCSPHIGHO2_12_FULL_39_8 TaxID=1802050 RepID=A0A1F7HXH4_9BACT|nr:MAG: isoleucine--tRNA ligase [Candidatus Roizmanbacteria bacterium RIFCSPHIGHO2_12_FULL_39_8]